MKLYSENKMKRSDLEKYLQNSLETAESVLLNLKRASELIRDFKQVAADQSAEEKRAFYVKNYVDKVLSSMESEISRRDVDVKINCERNLMIESYPLALSRILRNLVENSIHHGFEGRNGGAISVNITTVNREVYIEYSDDGTGIDKDIQGKIFDPFFTTKRGNGHTGLGLNVVYNLVTQTLKGSIKCESEKGSGAAFIIIFPI
jgi:signal transduction histidine kinase